MIYLKRSFESGLLNTNYHCLLGCKWTTSPLCGQKYFYTVPLFADMHTQVWSSVSRAVVLQDWVPEAPGIAGT